MKNTKKILAYLLSFLMIFTMIPVTAVAADKIAAEQSALAAEGWIAIDSAEDFMKIASGETGYPNNGKYYLTKDLHFGDIEKQNLV